MDYCRAHWLGQHSLVWSFGVNLLLLCAIINLAEPLVRPGDLDRSVPSLCLAGIYAIACHLVVYAWQVVGVMRTCARRRRANGDALGITVAQTAVIVSLVAGTVTAATTLQRVFAGLSPAVAAGAEALAPAAAPPYRLDVLAGGRLARIEGEFQTGLTRDLRALLARQAGIRELVLSSDGGRIFEARGVARLVRAYRLDTYVRETCQSACAIAFVAGERRGLGGDGRLGFHGYRLGAGTFLLDVAAEQEKDRAFYRSRGVAPALLARIFATPHDRIWYPGAAELLQAGVVHRVGEAGG